MKDTKFYTGLGKDAAGRAVILGSPFLERTAPLNVNALWMRWGDYMMGFCRKPFLLTGLSLASTVI